MSLDWRKNPVILRLIHGTGANLLGKVWVLVIQLASVPVLSHAWGTDGYGVWLMISTIPSFIAMSDFGLGIAAGIDITQAMTRGDTAYARKAYRSVRTFVSIFAGSVCLLAAVAAGIWLWNAGDEAVSTFSQGEVAGTIILSILYTFLSMRVNIQRIVFQATHKYALGTVLGDIWFLLSGLGVVLVASLGGGILEAAAIQLLVRIVGTLVTSQILYRTEPWAKGGFLEMDSAVLRRLIKPSLATFSLTLANSIGLQGVVLTIGWTMGPSMAATFSTARMLTRIPLQFSGLLVRASLPELTRSIVDKNSNMTRKLVRVNMITSTALMAPFIITFSLFGDRLIEWLSHGNLTASNWIFVILTLSATVCSVWTTLGSSHLLSRNQQGAYGHVALVIYLLSAMTPFFSNEQLWPIVVSTLFAEMAILLRVTRVINKNSLVPHDTGGLND